MSIVAHSLGAIICFDIMANQPKNQAGASSRDVPDNSPPAEGSAGEEGRGGERGAVGENNGDTEGGDQEDGEGCLRYYRGSTSFPTLSARIENVFCLGSPIGMFLMIRGQHRRLGKGFKLPG